MIVLALVACGGPGEPRGREPASAYMTGFYGVVAADEPHAALVGRDVLSSGGTAADAAVATYFAMAVTYPGAASLGGGGVCLLHDYEVGRTEALEFLATASSKRVSDAQRPSAVPGNVRGMAALHARYGQQSWTELLRPAELLARKGHFMSRALATELIPAADFLFSDLAARRIFSARDGNSVAEGQIVHQPELAAVLSVLRGRGSGEFYSGELARTLVEGVTAVGGMLTLEDLRGYKARYVEPIAVNFDAGVRSDVWLFGSDQFTLFFTPTVAGGIAAQLWSILDQDKRYRRTPIDEAPHLFTEALLRVSLGSARSLGKDGTSQVDGDKLLSKDHLVDLMRGYDRERHRAVPGTFPHTSHNDTASFVIADRFGQAVACNFTLNYPFGTGRVAPGTGILLAATPGTGDHQTNHLGAMMLVRQKTNNVFYGAVASGGSAAPAAMIRVALETLVGQADLSEAISNPRLYHPGFPDVVHAESGIAEAQRVSLTVRGHQLQAADRIGRVVAFYCPEGLPDQDRCECVTDPRGFGLAVGAE